MNYLLDLSRGQIKPEDLPTTSPRCLYFFICSAYTDFCLERRILRESLLPELRQYTRQKYGLDLCVIDPRPLEDIVPLESVNYQKLFKKLCLKYCKSNVDCCPIILLGQKYGLPLLPNRIPDRIYEILTRKLKQKAGNPYFAFTKDFDLGQWYQKDCNSLGEHKWCLRPFEWSGKHFQDQTFQVKSDLIRIWNQKKDFLVWLLYQAASSCFKEGLLTESDLDEIFIFELRTAVDSILDKGDQSAYHPLNESYYSPILLQRQIIDIRSHLNCPEVHRFLDLIPPCPPDFIDSGNQDENQPPQVNKLLVSKLNSLQNSLLSKWECSLAGTRQQMQILWRWPSGLNREFHHDYLEHFCEQLKSALISAIDLRAKHKLALLIPNLREHNILTEPHDFGQQRESQTTPVPVLNLAEHHLADHHLVAREFQKRIRVWDSAWNSINQIQWLYPVALNYKDEVDTVLCYIEDTDPNAEVPMLLYSTSKSNQTVKADYTCIANCVAAYACKEIQRRYTATEKYILIARIITSCSQLKYVLEDLADQLSIALSIDRARLSTDSLASLVYSISPENDQLLQRKLILVLAGIDKLELDSCCDTLSGLLPILQAPQIPGRLKNGLKLILAGELHITDIGPQSEDEGVLLPATSLNLEIQPQNVAGRFATSMTILNQMNRCLTDQQMFEVHKTLEQLSLNPNSHIVTCPLAKCILANTMSGEYMSADKLVGQLIQTNISSLASQTSLWLTSKTTNLILAMLKLTSDYENHGPGLNCEELREILSLSNETVEAQTNPDIIAKKLPLFCDCFSIQMFIQFLEEECITARVGISPPICTTNGYFVVKFSMNNDVDTANQQEANILLSDYFLGTWYNQPKPLTSTPVDSSSPIRVVTPQSIYFTKRPRELKTKTNILDFDLRFIRHMYLSLLHSKRFSELGSRTLFNFSWLYAKIYVLGVRDVLTDITILDTLLANSPTEQEWTNAVLMLRFEAKILADALGRASDSLTENPDSLATELIGQLLPNANASDCLANNFEHVFLRNLVRQCDQACPWYGVLVPTYSYPVTPGNPLLGSIKCPTPLNNICISKLQTQSESHVLIKLQNDPVIYRYNCSHQRELDSWRSSCGHLYMTPTSKYAVIIDELSNDTLKIHQLDIKINSCVPLIGQINIGLWLKALNSETSNSEEPLKIQIIQIDLTDLYVGLIVRTKNTTNTITNTNLPVDTINCDSLSEHLAPCDLNYVIVFELTTGKPLHMLSPTPLATVIKCCSFRKPSGDEFNTLNDDDVFFTNSGNQLLGFRIDTGEQFISVSLRSMPEKYILSKDSKRLFTFSNSEPSILYLQLDGSGDLDKSFRVSFQDILGTDTILDIKLANYMPFVLVHATQNILVYDYESDAIFVHIKRPANIPQRFRLPNSQYQELVFTAVEFGLHDQTVLASLFRNVFIWDIRLGIPLTTLNAPIGVLTNLLIDQSGRQLIGYNESLKELYLWDIPLALTNAAMNRRLPTGSGSQIVQTNKMDRLTKPITNLVCHSLCKPVLAFCNESDELGVFDSDTGQLTDLFTHDGYVMNVELSACGKYALVSISFNTKKRKYCNLIWSLESRSILTEYGNEIGYAMSRKYEPGHFLHLLPDYDDDDDNNVGSFVGYVLKSVLVCQERMLIPQVRIHTIPDVKIRNLVKPSKPFITSNDQHLVLLTSADQYDMSDQHSNPILTIWTMNKLTDSECPKGMLWQVQSFELKEKINEDALCIRILNCVPAPSGSMMLIFYARFGEFPKSYVNENLITGTGLSKGVIVADLQKTDSSREVTMMILRSVTGLNAETPMTAIHYSFLKAEVFDSHVGLYYRLPLDEKHVTTHSLTNLKPHFKVENRRMPIHFHGYVLRDNLCVFSSGSQIYLIRPDTNSIVTSIDTHHPITVINTYLTNDRIILIGCSDGYVLSFNLIDPFYDSIEPTRIPNLLIQLPTRSSLYLDQDEINRTGFEFDNDPKLNRSRSWDRTLEQEEICTNENTASELIEAIQRQITLMDEGTSRKSSESVDHRAASCSLL